MGIFYFDLIDDIEVHDNTGHSCADETEACQHGDFIAQRIGTEKPVVADKGMYISVRNGDGQEIYRAPVKTAGLVQ